MQISSWLSALAALVLLVHACPARAEWTRVLPGPIDQVAASAGHVAAARGGEVWLLGDDLTTLGLLTGRANVPVAPRAPHAVAQGAEEILDRHDVSVLERDSDWALELVEDERTLGQRRDALPSRLPAEQPGAMAQPWLAASENELWIAVGRAAWRVDAAGRAARIALGVPHGAVAAADGGLLLATREGLVLVPLGAEPPATTTLPVTAEKVALSATAKRWAWWDGGALHWTSAGERHSLVPSAPVVELAYCGETLIAVLANAVWTVPVDGAPVLGGGELRAQRWFCPAEPTRPWLASGQRLLASVDQGGSWTPVATPAGISLNGAVATAHHVWLATASGLFVSSAAGSPNDPAPPKRHGGLGKRRGGAAAWLAWLPKVSVQGMARVASGKREVEAMAIAQIPLEPRQLPVLRAAVDELTAPAALAPMVHPQASGEPGDPDRACLAPARRKAVELALAEPERAESYVTRAGHAAWLPELRALVSRRYGRSESLDVATSSTALSSPLGIDTVNDIRYEARATWDLAKLVFSTEELAAQNQALHMAELRRDIENTVNRLYFERRRLALEPGAGEAAARQVRRREIEAELDSLSAGAFGACIDTKP